MQSIVPLLNSIVIKMTWNILGGTIFIRQLEGNECMHTYIRERGFKNMYIRQRGDQI